MNANISNLNSSGTEIVHVADTSLAFREVALATAHPTGEQVALAAGVHAQPGLTVLALLINGELEDLGLSESINLADTSRRFVVAVSDRLYKFDVAGIEYDWPSRLISGGQIRKLANVENHTDVFQVLQDGVERTLGSHDIVDLDGRGVEQLYTRPHLWKLNVQGVQLEVPHPTISVRQAMSDAGFDVSKAWIIVLRVRGQENRPMGLEDVIDLRTPGMEKLRLTPREVVNGEGPALQRDFALLPEDVAFLNGLGCRWETRVEPGAQGSRCWLLVYGYPVPFGFTVTHTVLALEIPPTYPQAQIDMFYTHPRLALPSGQMIPSTQVAATVKGLPFNGWSRHRGPGAPWDPDTDNVVTHLALVESAMMKEV